MDMLRKAIRGQFDLIPIPVRKNLGSQFQIIERKKREAPLPVRAKVEEKDEPKREAPSVFHRLLKRRSFALRSRLVRRGIVGGVGASAGDEFRQFLHYRFKARKSVHSDSGEKERRLSPMSFFHAFVSSKAKQPLIVHPN
jgi:hypothetical protein